MKSKAKMDRTELTGETPLKVLIYNALVKRNPVLAAGLVIAPIIVYATTLKKAMILVITFSLITFFTLLFASFVPQKIVYTIRITLYTLIGALVYVPIVIILNSLMPEQIESMGIYFPLLIMNSFIISKSETTFFNETKSRMFIDIILSIIGYDFIVLLFGIIREILSTGEFNGQIIAMPIVFSSFSTVYGGFILLGIFAAVFRGIILFIRKFKA